MSLDWTEEYSKPKTLTTLIIAWATTQNYKIFERNVLTIEENDIKSTFSKIKEILEDSIILKVSLLCKFSTNCVRHRHIKKFFLMFSEMETFFLSSRRAEF